MTVIPLLLNQAAQSGVLRVVTYNIHKGVQGLGPARRLEIHNLLSAVQAMQADVICLQEVRGVNRKEARYFKAWPGLPQADFLAPEGYTAVYRTNAITQHGEHGNALLSRWPVLDVRHEDMSDHRFEQRGLLHVVLDVAGLPQPLHAIVVHFGLVPASRLRQVTQLRGYIAREVPADAPVLVAGDFNDWGTRLRRLLHLDALHTLHNGARAHTYPSRFPVVQLDQIFARGLQPLSLHAPRGRIWGRLSDHLPLIGEFGLPMLPMPGPAPRGGAVTIPAP